MTATAISSWRFHNAVEIHLFIGIHHSGPHPRDDPVLGNPSQTPVVIPKICFSFTLIFIKKIFSVNLLSFTFANGLLLFFPKQLHSKYSLLKKKGGRAGGSIFGDISLCGFVLGTSCSEKLVLLQAARNTEIFAIYVYMRICSCCVA